MGLSAAIIINLLVLEEIIILLVGLVLINVKVVVMLMDEWILSDTLNLLRRSNR